MPTENSSFTVSAENMDFRTLGVLYEQEGRKLSIYFEESPDGKGSWGATSDFSCWHTGEAVTDSEQQRIISNLNDWGRGQGWQFCGVAKNLRIEDIAPRRRRLFRIAQEAERRREEQRKKVYGEK